MKTSSAWRQIPGIVTVQGKKLWRYSGLWYLSGDVVSHRHDVLALGLIPLKITEHDDWDPSEEDWGETSEPESAWAKAIIANGPDQVWKWNRLFPATMETNGRTTSPEALI